LKNNYQDLKDLYTHQYGTGYLSLIKDMESCSRVFVYGTLKDTHSNNGILSTSKFLTSTETVSRFVLGDVGCPYAFPYEVVPSKYSKLLFPVRGEVYEIDDEYTFSSLDGLEGYPIHYNRRIITTEAGLTAWMYVQEDWSMAEYCSACKLNKGVWEWTGK